VKSALLASLPRLRWRASGRRPLVPPGSAKRVVDSHRRFRNPRQRTASRLLRIRPECPRVQNTFRLGQLFIALTDGTLCCTNTKLAA
jgi:hypothetical protein